jgi:hypothetical protein
MMFLSLSFLSHKFTIDPPLLFEEGRMLGVVGSGGRGSGLTHKQKQQQKKKFRQQRAKEAAAAAAEGGGSGGGAKIVRGDGLLILATDGVWQALTSQQAVDVCCQAADDYFQKMAEVAAAAR